jgi:hypothetical protein
MCVSVEGGNGVFEKRKGNLIYVEGKERGASYSVGILDGGIYRFLDSSGRKNS